LQSSLNFKLDLSGRCGSSSPCVNSEGKKAQRDMPWEKSGDPIFLKVEFSYLPAHNVLRINNLAVVCNCYNLRKNISLVQPIDKDFLPPCDITQRDLLIWRPYRLKRERFDNTSSFFCTPLLLDSEGRWRFSEIERRPAN